MCIIFFFARTYGSVSEVARLGNCISWLWVARWMMGTEHRSPTHTANALRWLRLKALLFVQRTCALELWAVYPVPCFFLSYSLSQSTDELHPLKVPLLDKSNRIREENNGKDFRPAWSPVCHNDSTIPPKQQMVHYWMCSTACPQKLIHGCSDFEGHIFVARSMKYLCFDFCLAFDVQRK